MKKVLVTGATGFLGKYVVEELVDHGYQVRAFGRNHTIGQSLVCLLYTSDAADE